MYPWLLGGTTSIGGNSTAPTNLKSYCGGFINMVFMVSSMLSGACATPEFLMYLNYFIQKDYGKDYWREPDKVVDLSLKQRTIDKVITDCFEQIVYSLNQPTGARNYQSVFWNIAYYDEPYFKSLFGEFRFPDGSEPDWEGLKWLQKRFMKWFNQERTKAVLTFPVETMALLYDKNGKFVDQDMADFTAEMYSEGHSFFTYISDNADSLSSCCRLRNEITDNGFSYTLGAGGVSTGSKSVLTINLNRCIQYAVNHGQDYKEFLTDIIDLCHKVQLAYNENLKDLQAHGMLPLFDAGYINIARQYLTIGVNGLVEAAEFMGIPINDNPQYREFVQTVLGLVEKKNKEYRTKEVMFNCEMIPAENVGVKHAKWDREDGYFVPRDCYVQLRDDPRRERGREARQVGPRGRLLRAARLLQLLLLHRRRPVAHRPGQIPPARRPLHRTPHRWFRSPLQPRGTPHPAAVHAAARGGRKRRLQLLHIQHPQHHLQRLRPHRQTLPERVPPLPFKERRLPDPRHRLPAPRLQLQQTSPAGSRPSLLRYYELILWSAIGLKIL